MTLPKIGETANDGDLRGRRDAYHMPGILADCCDELTPGTSVVFVDGRLTRVRACEEGENRHGIVDPFLAAPVDGEVFHVLLVPQLTANLTHHYDIDLGSGQEFYRPEGETARDADDPCRWCG